MSKIERKTVIKNKFLVWGLFLIIAAFGYGSFLLWHQLTTASPASVGSIEQLAAPEQEIATSTRSRRLIDGVWVEPAAASSSVFGAMIDNQPEAQPQAGLDRAALVWEAPVEGGMTRFLAIWPTTVPVEKIGPVRSARPYFLDWIKEVNGLYLHVGGSAQALDVLKIKGIADLNEYYRGWYFWRDSSRRRPHNVFTSSALVSKALDDYPRLSKQIGGEAESWLYQEEAPLDERGFLDPPPIDYGVIKVNWRYNREKNIYERFAGEEPHLTADGVPLTAKNVIYLYMVIRSIDEADRKEIKTLGNGRAVVARDGKIIERFWRKERQEQRTRFFYPSLSSSPLGGEGGVREQEIKLNAGTTWIEVLPSYNYH